LSNVTYVHVHVRYDVVLIIIVLLTYGSKFAVASRGFSTTAWLLSIIFMPERVMCRRHCSEWRKYFWRRYRCL